MNTSTAPVSPAAGGVASEQLLAILQHSLGLTQYGAGGEYRNHFVTGEGCDDFRACRQLVAMGLMSESSPNPLTGGNPCFHVTPDGRKYVTEHSPSPPRLTHSQRRYLDYVRVSDFYQGFGDYLRQHSGARRDKSEDSGQLRATRERG